MPGIIVDRPFAFTAREVLVRNIWTVWTREVHYEEKNGNCENTWVQIRPQAIKYQSTGAKRLRHFFSE